MSDIANLQEAVETARAAYARASEQHARSRKHALSLIHIVEEQLRDKRIELSQNDVQRERMTREYGQLRQMLHTLVMAVEVGAAGIPGTGPTAIEAQPNGVLPLAPVAVASEPKAPAAETVRNPKPRRKRAQAGAAKAGAGAEELRAGLKRMLKKKQTPAAELETVKSDGTEAPAPAE
jgi:hypothetical protein